MAKIMMTPENLREQAKTLRGKKAEHEQLYSQIKDHVRNIVSVWEGQSQQAFLDSFNQRNAQFRKFAEDLEQFAQLMDTAATEMANAEQSLTQKMRV